MQACHCRRLHYTSILRRSYYRQLPQPYNPSLLPFIHPQAPQHFLGNTSLFVYGCKVRLCGYGDIPILHIGITTEYAHIHRRCLINYFIFQFGMISWCRYSIFKVRSHESFSMWTDRTSLNYTIVLIRTSLDKIQY